MTRFRRWLRCLIRRALHTLFVLGVASVPGLALAQGAPAGVPIDPINPLNALVPAGGPTWSHVLLGLLVWAAWRWAWPLLTAKMDAKKAALLEAAITKAAPDVGALISHPDFVALKKTVEDLAGALPALVAPGAAPTLGADAENAIRDAVNAAVGPSIQSVTMALADLARLAGDVRSLLDAHAASAKASEINIVDDQDVQSPPTARGA